MIVVHVNQTWPQVQEGNLGQAEAVLGRWPIAQDKIDQFGDTVAGVKDNIVVDVYDVTGYARDGDNKVIFDGLQSKRWAHLIGQPTPTKPWGRQGDAWPVRFIDTAVVAGGDVPVQPSESGRRAVVGDFTLIVDDQGNATLLTPAGRSITVRTS